MSDKKKNGGALLGAAFLMATSAIGPGFLTQTSKFTSDFQASFGFRDPDLHSSVSSGADEYLESALCDWSERTGGCQ